VRGVITIGTALASVVLLLGVATACGDGDDDSATTGDPPPVPTELADGTTPVPMPDGLRRFRGRPVIQAKELPGQAAEILCPPDRSREGRTSPAGSWISTEGLSVGYLIRGTTELYTCDAAFADGNWEPCSSKSLTASSAEEFVERESASTCEEPEPARSYLWVVVPSQRVAWTLVDHRSFWVAYLSANKPLVRISNVGEEFNSTVAFVDQQGNVIEERQIEDGKPV
jgi:hypothetical protein